MLLSFLMLAVMLGFFGLFMALVVFCERVISPQ